jgi:hypothetical protein
MRNTRGAAARALTTIASVALVGCTTARVQTAGGEVEIVPRAVSNVIASWSNAQKEAATTVIGKYGQPDLVGDRMLVWYNKGPYVTIALNRDAQPHDFPMPHTDFLTQTVKYALPLDKLDELAQYDGSVWFHRTRGELSAQCDKEEMNNLALNLASDVATGKRSVADARAFYATTAMEFKQGNRSSPYVTGLIFPTNSATADRDKPHL